MKYHVGIKNMTLNDALKKKKAKILQVRNQRNVKGKIPRADGLLMYEICLTVRNNQNITGASIFKILSC